MRRPLDPDFLGKGQVLTTTRAATGGDGQAWRILENHVFAWRPAHIHFSLFGNCYAQRLITQFLPR